MTLWIAQLAVLVDASGQKVVEKAFLHPLKFVDELLGAANGLIDGVEDVGNTSLFGRRGIGYANRSEQFDAERRPRCARQEHCNLIMDSAGAEAVQQKSRVGPGWLYEGHRR